MSSQRQPPVDLTEEDIAEICETHKPEELAAYIAFLLDMYRQQKREADTWRRKYLDLKANHEAFTKGER